MTITVRVNEWEGAWAMKGGGRTAGDGRRAVSDADFADGCPSPSRCDQAHNIPCETGLEGWNCV